MRNAFNVAQTFLSVSEQSLQTGMSVLHFYEFLKLKYLRVDLQKMC